MTFAKTGNIGVMDIYMSVTPSPGATQTAILYGFGFNYDQTNWDVTGYSASLFSGSLSSGVSLTTASFPLVEPFNAQGLGNTLRFDVGAGQPTPSNSGWKGGALTSGAVGHFQFTFNALTPGAGFTPDVFFQTGSGPGGLSDFMFEFKQTGTGQSDRFAVDLIVTLEPVPEPSTYGLLGSAALVGVAVFVRRRHSTIRR
jgi:hypothetical protein